MSFSYRISRTDPLYNLASDLYTENWEEGIFGLTLSGHCHTFNPENVSLSGLRGQHSLHLGDRESRYDLDLTYVTDRIIAMGFPSASSSLESMFRNSVDEVQMFLEEKHKNCYKGRISK